MCDFDLFSIHHQPLSKDVMAQAELSVGYVCRKSGYRLERTPRGYSLRSLAGEYVVKGPMTLGEVVDLVLDHPRQRPTDDDDLHPPPGPEKVVQHGRKIGWMRFVD